MKKWIKATLFILLTICVIECSVNARESCTEVGSTRIDNYSIALQVCHWDQLQKSWFYVCRDNWNIMSLDVYCRQAGYIGGSELGGIERNRTASWKEMEEDLRLMITNCTGDEISLLECNYTLHDGDCLFLQVNERENCRNCQIHGDCNGKYCVNGKCQGTKSSHKLIASIVGTVVFSTVLVLICVVVTSIYQWIKKRRKSRNTSTIDIQLHEVTIKDYANEDNTQWAAADTRGLFTNYWSLTDNETEDIECGAEETALYLEPNAVLNRDECCSLESELYGVLVEGEVTDYEEYDRLSQINTEVIYDTLAYKYQKIFPNDEIAIVTTESSKRNTSIYVEPPTSLPQLEDVFEQCFNEINRGEIEMGKEFASGQFGVVYRAVYHTQRGDIPVAIKTLKETSDTDTKVAFMREAAILAQFQHPNVLRLIGVLTAQQPYMMVTELLKTELAELLLKFKVLLKANTTTNNNNNKNSSGNNSAGDLTAQKLNLPNLLLRFAQEIAAGMQHLSDKHFIHRDLAARNVLVAKDLSCRIADFGMSRELISDSEYYTSSGGRIPLRWTAPEAIFYKKYSEKSDVWSFGMTLFEIWSLGEKPWGRDATNEEIIEGLSEGRKLSPPTGCPRDVYSVMVETWRMDASSRPTFSTILHLLTNIHLSTAPPLSPETDPSLCLGNDPVLSKHHFPDLQKLY